MRFALMIEGQEDVSWDDWRRLAQSAIDLGFHALFRSDHYLSADGQDARGSLDAWSTIAALGAVTDGLRLGTLVSPATFRHPSVLAKTVVTADHISGGRVELGIGAGWLESEHRSYGFPFPPLRTRLDRLAEQLRIIRGSWGTGPFTFRGEHWSVEELDALPKPMQQPCPPLILGGMGGARSVAIAAELASEYNVFYASPDEAWAIRERLDAACDQIGRDPSTLSFSLMDGFLIGETTGELESRALELEAWQGKPIDIDELRATWLVGSPTEITGRLGEYGDAGIERVMLQHHLIDDAEALRLFAEQVAPALIS